LLLGGKRLSTDDSGHGQPGDRPYGDKEQNEVLIEDHHQDDDEEDKGQRIEDIDHPHHQRVDSATDESGCRSVEHADHQADEGGDDPDRERDARAVERANEEIASHRIRAEPVSTTRAATYRILGPPGWRAGNHAVILIAE